LVLVEVLSSDALNLASEPNTSAISETAILFIKAGDMLHSKNIRAETELALQFISKKWDDLIGNARNGHDDAFVDWRALAASSLDGHLDDTDPSNPYILFLPNNFVIPGGRFVVQFYWDSYFIILSLILDKRYELAKGIVENALYLVEKHGMVIANRKRWSAGSQLPFLSEMVRVIYDSSKDKAWLKNAMQIIRKEYDGYWLNEDHLAYRGLSRYHAPSCYPKDSIAEITLDNEATWDLSSRFDVEDVLQLLPVDLNCNLFRYETNFAYFCAEIEQENLAEHWKSVATQRKKLINELMWDEEDGMYYDYNFELGVRKRVRSLVTYFPLFYELADQSQAARVEKNTIRFACEFGLATCDQSYGYVDRQWNYPLGWAPLHWIAFRGLSNYGYLNTAENFALKWLDLNLDIWKKTNCFFEKYDVVNGTHEVIVDNRYSNQEGFGWTNAVFHALTVELCHKNDDIS
jgi:alpha,alpha-trehalase